MQSIAHKVGSALLILGLAIAIAALPRPAAAQDPINLTDQGWDAEFRQHLTFTASAEGSAPIEKVDLFYRVVGQLATSRNEATFTPGTSIEAEFSIDQTDPSNYLPPGAELEYWWKIVDANGNELKTERETLLYQDNRFDWQKLENERLSLFWYEGDQNFGQELFDRANLALDTLETDIGIALENPIKIFIYANHRDLLSALSATAQEWTGGVAYTTYGVVVIGVSPSQLDWGLNATTHEMSHLVIHQATDNPFGGLPRWLDEGIAVYNENQDELDDDFKPLFDRAVKENKLMTLRTLSSPFPADPVLANLAYGQSGAVVKFIVDTYGPEKMARLLEIFSEGALYDEALTEALGVDTDGLDNAFRASLELPPLPGTETAGAESSAGAAAEAPSTEVEPPVEKDSSAPAQAGSAVEESAPPAAESEPEAPAAAPEEPTQSPAGLLGIPCLAGLLALLVMGAAVHGLRSS